MSIGSQYAASTGMTFSLEGAGTPVIASEGGARTAFQGYGGAPDQLAPGQLGGPWFLTDDGVVAKTAPTLDISYSSAFSHVGGEILDIDGTESWQIEAYNSAHTLLDSILIASSSSGTGDGIATAWAFNHLLADISLVRIVYMGGFEHDVGVGYDNFWTGSLPDLTPGVTTPEPASLTLLGTGLLALVVPAWRRHRRRSAMSP
ncbi:MAG TPA: PEP-CTERM sorting domain-containing protein [Planctomycetaceae bacterium]|nr:PEP-CTERM sorting domain-containing protein [Planctomycetaceae bacterium]